MKKALIVLAAAVLLSGCITIPDAATQAFVDYGKSRLAEYDVTLTQVDMDTALAKAQPEIDKLLAEFPALVPIMPELVRIAGLVAAGQTNLASYTSPEGSLYAGFLLNDAAIRVMNKLSINANADDYTKLLKTLKDFGFNQIPFFLANEGDGGPVPTTFYRDAWFGAIDQDRVEMMRFRIKQAKDMGFAVELWGIADDSSSLSSATPEQLNGFYENCVALFGDLADSWCVGLELDEWGERWWNKLWHKPDMTVIQGAVAILKATGKPVAVHLTSYKKIDLALQSGADTFNAQFGWLKSASEMTKAMAWINARKGNMRVVATEFNRDSVTPLATALATEAMRCGAVGTQTGRPE
jgi:hypothetical protein